MKDIKIAVFPCGSEVGLEIHRALSNIPFITLFGASSTSDHGKYIYKNYIEGIPFVDDDYFIESFNYFLVNEQIDYIFPAMDSVQYFLAENQEKLQAKLIGCNFNAIQICNSKSRTYKALKDCHFLPTIYKDPTQIINFPIIMKPAVGSSSIGVTLITNQEDLAFEYNNRSSEQVLCEYLPGEEFTIDCFTDRYGKLRFVSARQRKRIKAGISVQSALVETNEEIQTIAQQINTRIPMQGNWFFQLKYDVNNTLKLLEVATRVSGTMGLQRAAGINLPLLTVYDLLGYDISLDQQFYQLEVDRALHSKYKMPFNFTELYIDFDDTIVVHNQVNLEAIHLLYQCINQNIPIYLITKHDNNIYTTLEKYHIDVHIFDKIIHIEKDKNKGDYMSPTETSVFVDDSFSEREKVQKKWHIVCLGVDAIETLLSYKR